MVESMLLAEPKKKEFLLLFFYKINNIPRIAGNYYTLQVYILCTCARQGTNNHQAPEFFFAFIVRMYAYTTI